MSTNTSQNQNKKLEKFLTDFMLGGISATISKTAVAPLERIKLIFQSQDSHPKIISGEIPRYTGMVNCFQRVVKEEGYQSLWRGNMANIIRYFPTQALNFAFKDTYKEILCPYDSKKEPLKFFLGNIAAGGAAGASSSLFVYPLDFARTRLAADLGEIKQFKGLNDCISQIYKADGIKGLYQGFTVSVVGIIVYRGAFFGLFDSAKGFGLKDQNVILKFLVAQLISNSAAMLSYPLDTVRRRLMMQVGENKLQYKGFYDCVSQIHKEEGINGFFKGSTANIFRGIGGALILVMYDEAQEYIKNKKNKN